MSAYQPNRRFPELLGYALLLGCATAALWLATAVMVPSAQYIMRLYGTPVPAFFAQAFHVQTFCYYLVVPIAVGGGALVVIALLGRGPARLVASSRMALAILSGLVACLSLYLLSSAGVAYKVASSDQMAEVKLYKGRLDQFVLLEAAHGRYDKLRESFLKTRDFKLVEAQKASEFNDAEARKRVFTLIGVLAQADDIAMKKRILATLGLFRERVRKDDYEARYLLSHATEAGAPSSNSHVETLQWIAANLNKDGWDPLPLFKLSP
jgi:hypothetical protein